MYDIVPLGPTASGNKRCYCAHDKKSSLSKFDQTKSTQKSNT